MAQVVGSRPTYVVLCDKLAVRDFIAWRVGTDVLVPLLWVGENPDCVPCR